MKILNVSAYKFVPVHDLEVLQKNLLRAGKNKNFKGTILLGAEGLNLNLAGDPLAIKNFCTYLNSDERFSDLSYKKSYSDFIPFRRFSVKIKAEIIRLDYQYKHQTASPNKMPPQLLKQWMDEKRDFILLDTRNDYETELGTFQSAKTLPLKTFRDFPQELATLPKDKPIVMFCTGGIRCEKALPMLQEAGFNNVWQLEGGILNYFQECQGAHWQGNCFVFDDRIALTPDLEVVQ